MEATQIKTGEGVGSCTALLVSQSSCGECDSLARHSLSLVLGIQSAAVCSLCCAHVRYSFTNEFLCLRVGCGLPYST